MKTKFRLSNNELRKFPQNLPTGLHELYLAENELENLINVNSKTCSIKTKNLRILDLSGNKIKFLTCSFFTQLLMLKYLDLSGNILQVVDFDCFSYAKKLKYLFLHDNAQLKQIVALDVSVLSQLEYFAVHRCSLKVLEISDRFKWNEVDFSVALKGIWLFENPITCDCKIKPLVRYLKNHSVELDPVNETYFKELVDTNFRRTLTKKLKGFLKNATFTECIGPLNRYRAVAGKPLLVVPESHFTCPDEIKYIIISSFLGLIAFFGVIPFISILIHSYLTCRRFVIKHFACNKEKEE